MVEVDSLALLEPGEPAPAFALKGTDGAVHALADYADREAVLLVFTCNHCQFSQSKVPVMNGLAADYDRVAVVGVNPNETPAYLEDSYERMVELVEAGTVRYDDYLVDSTQSVAAAYGVTCTPDPFLLENDGGTFRLAYHGRLDDAMRPDAEADREEMREAIESLMAGEPIDLPGAPSRGCSVKWLEGNEPEYWARV